MGGWVGRHAAGVRVCFLLPQLEAKQKETGIKLLWGTANLFSHARFMNGASTNPDPEIFARGAAQVKKAMEVTHRLGGQNYVLWGGREGYQVCVHACTRCFIQTERSRRRDRSARVVGVAQTDPILTRPTSHLPLRRCSTPT